MVTVMEMVGSASWNSFLAANVIGSFVNWPKRRGLAQATILLYPGRAGGRRPNLISPRCVCDFDPEAGGGQASGRCRGGDHTA
jgi:hypothetical protein